MFQTNSIHRQITSSKNIMFWTLKPPMIKFENGNLKSLIWYDRVEILAVGKLLCIDFKSLKNLRKSILVNYLKCIYKIGGLQVENLIFQTVSDIFHWRICNLKKWVFEHIIFWEMQHVIPGWVKQTDDMLTNVMQIKLSLP